jgi:hypothetical protein
LPTALRPRDAGILLALILALTTLVGLNPAFREPGPSDPHPALADPGGWTAGVTEPRSGAWAPLTHLSLRVDRIVTLDDGGRTTRRVNLVLHALDVVLLLWALLRFGVTTPIATAVASVFALHPLQVPILLTADGRALLLGSSFWNLGLLLYAARPRRPLRVAEDVSLLGCVFFGALAHPIVLTLPVALLLIDRWPLARPSFRVAIVEKIPLLSLSAALALFLAWTAWPPAGPGWPPVSWRVAHAFDALVSSLIDLAWPFHLSPIHATALEANWNRALADAGLLAGITLVSWRTGIAARFGWSWYLLLVLPSVVFAGGGPEYRQESWLHLAMLGPTWALADCALRVRPRRRVSILAATLVLVALAGQTWRQLETWADPMNRCRVALRADPENWVARSRLASFLADRSDPGAERAALAALVLQPRQVSTQLSLARAIEARGDRESALRVYRNVLASGWRDEDAGSRLGHVLLRTGHPTAAKRLFTHARRVERGGDALVGLAQLDVWAGDFDDARNRLATAWQMGLRTPPARLTLAWLLATAPSEELRDPEASLRLCKGLDTPESRAVAAAAHAAGGDFATALATAQDAATELELQGWPKLAARVREQALGYMQRQPWTDRRRLDPVSNEEMGE